MSDYGEFFHMKQHRAWDKKRINISIRQTLALCSYYQLKSNIEHNHFLGKIMRNMISERLETDIELEADADVITKLSLASVSNLSKLTPKTFKLSLDQSKHYFCMSRNDAGKMAWAVRGCDSEWHKYCQCRNEYGRKFDAMYELYLVKWLNYPNRKSEDKFPYTSVQTFRFFTFVHLSLVVVVVASFFVLRWFTQVVIWFVSFTILSDISVGINNAMATRPHGHTHKFLVLRLFSSCKWNCGFLVLCPSHALHLEIQKLHI